MADAGVDLDYKRFVAHAKDIDGQGTGRLVVATLGVVDLDGDVTEAGFFGRQHVQLVPSHDWDHVPLGKGVLYEQGNEAIVDFTFNLSIASAVDWFEAIRFDLDNPPALQQYSYGFKVHAGGERRGTFAGRPVRFLQPRPDGRPGAEVFEVSPVLRGAGIGTRTVAVGGGTDRLPGSDDLRDVELRSIAALNGVKIGRQPSRSDVEHEYLRFVANSRP